MKDEKEHSLVPPRQAQGFCADASFSSFILHPSSLQPLSGVRLIAPALVLCTAGVLVARVAGYRWVDSFAAYFIAITLSATPYILMGALLSGLVEVFLPPTALATFTRRLGPWSVVATALAAPLFPICECGIVALVRRLIRKGLPLNHALTYLLAAPIINPIVFFSTYVAFQDLTHPLIRTIGGFLVAVAIGYAFSRVKPEYALLPEFLEGANGCGCADDDAHEPTGRIEAVARNTRIDFLEMIPYFLMGVFIASGMKTFLGDNLMTLAERYPVFGPAFMMALAFVLSLCSEADAFPAASFTSFSTVAHAGYLVLGPMLDIKLLLMYRTMFRARFIAVFAAAIVAGVSAYLLLLEAIL